MYERTISLRRTMSTYLLYFSYTLRNTFVDFIYNLDFKLELYSIVFHDGFSLIFSWIFLQTEKNHVKSTLLAKYYHNIHMIIINKKTYQQYNSIKCECRIQNMKFMVRLRGMNIEILKTDHKIK